MQGGLALSNNLLESQQLLTKHGAHSDASPLALSVPYIYNLLPYPYLPSGCVPHFFLLVQDPFPRPEGRLIGNSIEGRPKNTEGPA